MGFDVCMEDTPAESKTGGTSFHHGLHPTDMQGQAKIQHPSKWADNIYSRKFGETIDAGDDNHGGGRSESTAPKKKLRICNQNFVQPKKDESKNLDDKNRDDDNCDDNNRADHHDDDDDCTKTDTDSRLRWSRLLQHNKTPAGPPHQSSSPFVEGQHAV